MSSINELNQIIEESKKLSGIGEIQPDNWIPKVKDVVIATYKGGFIEENKVSHITDISINNISNRLTISLRHSNSTYTLAFLKENFRKATNEECKNYIIS